MSAATTATKPDEAVTEERQASARRVSRLLQDAFTRAEIEAARAANDDHVRRWPQDAAADWGHGFHYCVAALEAREAEAHTLGLTPGEAAERETLLKDTLVPGVTYQTEERPRLEHALAALDAWLARFPRDPSVRDRRDGVASDLELTDLVSDAAAETRPVLAAA